MALELELELEEATDAESLLCCKREWMESSAESRRLGSPDIEEGEAARGECGSGAMGRYVVAGADRVVIRSSSESEAADEAEDMFAMI